jgi:hypothetical protein
MTKKEKAQINLQVGRIWMELRALSNSDRRNIRTGEDWTNLQAKHRAVIESHEELNSALLEKYPTKLEELKNLRYTSDIEKTIRCLNAIVVSDS